MRPRQNGRHFPDDSFKCILLNENVLISLKISLKFLPDVPVNNITALVLIMVWRRTGDEPLSEPWWLVHRRIYASTGINGLTHSCKNRLDGVLIILTCILHRLDKTSYNMLFTKCFPLTFDILSQHKWFVPMFIKAHTACKQFQASTQHRPITLSITDYRHDFGKQCLQKQTYRYCIGIIFPMIVPLIYVF